MYKAILFDFDDTLVDSVKAKIAQHRKAYYLIRGKEITDEHVIVHWGKAFDIMCQLIYE